MHVTRLRVWHNHPSKYRNILANPCVVFKRFCSELATEPGYKQKQIQQCIGTCWLLPMPCSERALHAQLARVAEQQIHTHVKPHVTAAQLHMYIALAGTRPASCATSAIIQPTIHMMHPS